MDPLNWALLLLAAAGVFVYFKWTKAPVPTAQSTVNEDTRKQAHPLILPPAEGAATDLFELTPVPLAIRPTPRLSSVTHSLGSFNPVIRDALWLPQRQMILRLEGELEMAQQAEASEHFVIAGPANQPGALLARTVAELEKVLAFLVKSFELPQPVELWYGRAMVLLLSNRKLFDHVAWLTRAGVAGSTTGSYFLAEQRIVLIPIYATRLGGFGAALQQQVSRAFLYCLMGQTGRYSQWVEEGLARWIDAQAPRIADRAAVAPASPVAADASTAFDPRTIVTPDAWAQAKDDPATLDRLSSTSQQVIAWLMARHRGALLKYLQAAKGAPNPDALWHQALGLDAAGLVGAWTSENPTPTPPKT